jgi:arsenate reductase
VSRFKQPDTGVAPESGLKPSRKEKKKVLFVCIGNSCRSQMAEAFARRYGSDVMVPSSGGLAPASIVSAMTRKVMLDYKGISLDDHYPKLLFDAPGSPWDLVVNISGALLPPNFPCAEARDWAVRDPVLDPEPLHLKVVEQIEGLVQQLILELRDATASRTGAGCAT